MEKTGWWALGLDALLWIFNCHQPFEAEVALVGRGGVLSNVLLGVLKMLPFISTQCKHMAPSFSSRHPSIHRHVWKLMLLHSKQVHTFSTIHLSIYPSPAPVLCAVMLSDAPLLPTSLASSSVACHGGCAPSKLIGSPFFQKDVAGYHRALRSLATGGAWLAGSLLKTVIPPLMPPSWKFRIVSAKTPYAK